MAQFTALGCAVSSHCHIREGADICGQEREEKHHQREFHSDKHWSNFHLKKSCKKAFVNRNGVI